MRVKSLKPAAPARVQYLLAALLWTGVGTFLLYRGLTAAIDAHPLLLLMVSLGAGLIGAAKGLGVMGPAARRGAERIALRGDGTCVMGFISWKSWLLVISMAIFGKYLRAADLPGWLLGLILGGVGLALLIGSRVYWNSFLAPLNAPPSSDQTPPG